GYTPGFLFNQMREIITAIAYVNTFRLMIRLFSGKNKDSISIIALLIPIVVFVAMVLVTSDRNIFIRYAFYFICLYVLFFRENCRKRNVNLRIIQKVIILGVILLLIFFLLGKLKQYSSGLTRVIGIYGGSGLYDFNLWIEDFKGPFLNGNATFTALLGSLKTIFGYIGIDLNVETLNRFDAFIEYKSANGYIYSSNIYSAMKPFVEDFGYFGVILFPFIIGAFYQWLFNKMKKRKYGFGWVVYSMLIYPVLFFPIAEQLFGRFTLGFVYELFWLSVLYFAIFGKKKHRSVTRQSAKVTGVLNEG
ncbi:MAG: oligosaccharide repeat unit polymerase, partial [Clostridia bacterium]|nr:oligosaccharide repeat unit polymerase [Clostridia bacterium]